MPQSVRDEGWQAWEAQRMQCEDMNALQPPVTPGCDTSDSEMSCLSAADSPRTRGLKLDSLVYGMNSNQRDHLRHIKRKAQRSVHDGHRRNNSKTSHFEDLVGDISAILSWQTHQTREADGTFGRLDVH